MSDEPCVPMPNTAHPYYEDVRDVIARWLDTGAGTTVCVPAPPTPFAIDDISTIAPSAGPIALHRKKAWAFAPYVGEPFVYAWFVAEDDLGRTVAGDAQIEAQPPHPTRLADRLKHPVQDVEDDPLKTFLDDLSDREW
jgi:hypothetical protein